ncbi:MAG: hypothetical protein RMJ88_08660 [Thermogemmata sp.]|nr:hypothetical protein [Thermogemmata sp.]
MLRSVGIPLPYPADQSPVVASPSSVGTRLRQRRSPSRCDRGRSRWPSQRTGPQADDTGPAMPLASDLLNEGTTPPESTSWQDYRRTLRHCLRALRRLRRRLQSVPPTRRRRLCRRYPFCLLPFFRDCVALLRSVLHPATVPTIGQRTDSEHANHPCNEIDAHKYSHSKGITATASSSPAPQTEAVARTEAPAGTGTPCVEEFNNFQQATDHAQYPFNNLQQTRSVEQPQSTAVDASSCETTWASPVHQRIDQGRPAGWHRNGKRTIGVGSGVRPVIDLTDSADSKGELSSFSLPEMSTVAWKGGLQRRRLCAGNTSSTRLSVMQPPPIRSRVRWNVPNVVGKTHARELVLLLAARRWWKVRLPVIATVSPSDRPPGARLDRKTHTSVMTTAPRSRAPPNVL